MDLHSVVKLTAHCEGIFCNQGLWQSLNAIYWIEMAPDFRKGHAKLKSGTATDETIVTWYTSNVTYFLRCSSGKCLEL